MITRRRFVSLLAAAPVALHSITLNAGDTIKRITYPEAKWRKLLSPQQFRILRKAGTEAPHSSALNKEKRAGTYVCAGCALPLFASSAKYDSRTGWPSFNAALPGAVNTETDYKLIWPRTEYHCARCDGHQGHVFNDGPAPTGKRYCNNGLALTFDAA